MDDADVHRFFLSMKAHGYQHVTLIGGEPYVRPGLLSKIVGIIPQNWLITSGTSTLLHFERTTHIISIDGKDAETHDRIRKSPGLFGRILKNLGKAREEWRGAFPAVGHSVLNSQNYRQIPEILRFWKDNALLDGAFFSTATPIQGAHDEHLKLSWDQQSSITEELCRQKEVFGDFLLMSKQMIAHLDPHKIRRQNAATCRTSKLVSSFAADGSRISQCVLSPKADCRACGCVITGILDGIYRADLGTLRIVERLISAN